MDFDCISSTQHWSIGLAHLREAAGSCVAVRLLHTSMFSWIIRFFFLQIRSATDFDGVARLANASYACAMRFIVRQVVSEFPAICDALDAREVQNFLIFLAISSFPPVLLSTDIRRFPVYFRSKTPPTWMVLAPVAPPITCTNVATRRLYARCLLILRAGQTLVFQYMQNHAKPGVHLEQAAGATISPKFGPCARCSPRVWF